MNKDIIKEISTDLNIKTNQVEAVLRLLEEGNTIPFISRYRKEATGNLDEEQIRKINVVYEYQVNLLKRKEDVIRLIDEKELMTDALRDQIMRATKLIEVEDLYRPYKEKKKTKATEAIKNGLEPLAKKILEFPMSGTIDDLVDPFVNGKVPNREEAIKGAGYIIAEYVSDDANCRKWVRSFIYRNGIITSKIKKNAEDPNKTYEMYYDYSEPIRTMKSHRVLAINRCEKENVVTINIEKNTDEIFEYLKSNFIKNDKSFVCSIVEEAIIDSYKRLIEPSVEREIRSELTGKAEEVAIENFAKNLENLLLQPPMKEKMVLGFDPAFRTGCKLAVIDQTGKKIAVEVIYPHEPIKKYKESKEKVLGLIHTYNIDIIAIGNGTASRESEAFIVDVIKECKKKVQYLIVSEAGASVYSASKLAIEEFPDLTVEKRSAISIGRRLQDPLSELVKIDPESIGVGLYQHDVSNKELTKSLDFTVSKIVNQVGVNINTASSALLKYVSGINKKNIEKLLDYRNTKGKFVSREEIKKKKLLSDKTYEQAIGFLRVPEADNILDRTSIHPESYKEALALLEELKLDLNDIGTSKAIDAINYFNPATYIAKTGIDKYTLEDIMKDIQKPNRDPRDEMDKPLLKSDILDITHLVVGMKLQGTVRNVVDFGAFIDIGLHDDGLAHISKLADRYIKHPSDVVSVGDIVDCYVDSINLEKQKVSLSLVKKDT